MILARFKSLMSMKRKLLSFFLFFSLSFVGFSLLWWAVISFYPEWLGQNNLDANTLKGLSLQEGFKSVFPSEPKKQAPIKPDASKSTEAKASSSTESDKSTEKQESAQAEKLETKESFIKSPLFAELQKNIKALFDPYAVQLLTEEDTVLKNEKNSYINKNKKEIRLKRPQANAPLHAKASPLAKAKNSLPLNPSLNPALKSGSSKQSESLDDLAPLFPVKKVREPYYERNKKQLDEIESSQEFFKTRGKFSFLINAFSQEEKALEYIEKMKSSYPFWSFLMKSGKGSIRVYLGPFLSKKQALAFKEELSQPYPVSSLDFLEEIGLEPGPENKQPSNKGKN